MRARTTVAISMLLTLVGPGAFARAQAVTAEQRAAVEAFDQADRLGAAGRWQEACAKYTESQRLDPQLGALLHVADCNERIGKLATALDAFRSASALAEQRKDPRLQLARERSAALAPRVAQLRIRALALPLGLRVQLDGMPVAVERTGTTLAVDAGEHALRAEAPGHAAWTRVVRVADGTREELAIPALEPVSSAPSPAPSAELTASELERDEPAARGTTQRVLGWVAIGTGAAAGIAAGVFFAAKGEKGEDVSALEAEYAPTICDECANSEARAREFEQAKRPLVDDQKQLRTLGIASAVAGGALAALGVTLLLTAPSADGEALALSPAFDRHSAGVLASGRF